MASLCICRNAFSLQGFCCGICPVYYLFSKYFTQYCSGDKIEKNKMGEVCSKYGQRRGVCRFLTENLRERDHLEDPGVDARIILRWIFRKLDVGIWTKSS
jgi:hypothetical protein